MALTADFLPELTEGYPTLVTAPTLVTGGASLRTRVERTRIYRLAEYGPVEAVTVDGPLRPTDVRYGQGLQFDTGSAHALTHALPDPLAAPVTASVWFRPATTPAAAKGLLALRPAGSGGLEVQYDATSVRVVGGPSVPLAIAGGDQVFAAVTLGPAGIVLWAGKRDGALVSAVGGAAPAALYARVDVGFAAGAPAGAGLEQLLVHAAQLPGAQVAELFLNGMPRDYADDPRTVLAALTPTAPGTTALTADGTGRYAVRSTDGTDGVRNDATVGPLEPGGEYDPDGASVLIDLPAPSGITTGDVLRLDDGQTVIVLRVVTSTTRDELYAA